MTLGDRADRRDRIERDGRRRAGRRDDRAGQPAGGAIGRDRRFQGIGPDRMDGVGLNKADIVAAKARQQRSLVDRTMRLGRGVDEQRRFARLQPAVREGIAARRFSRAQISATSVLVEAVSWITPLQASDRLTICRTQSTTTSSSSVKAGLACQDRPSAPSPVLR